MIRALVTLSVFAATLFAQRSVPVEFMYHRVWAIVPMVGSGTAADPSRPMLVPPPPTAGQQPSAERPDLLGYQMQLSDNGKFALVEFVFQSPLAFHNFLVQATASPGLGV